MEALNQAWTRICDFFRLSWKTTSLGDVLGVIGVSLSVVSLVFANDLQKDAIIYIFGAYLLVFFTFLLWREFAYSRKARYAEAVKSLHDCTHEIRDAYYAARKADKELCHKSMQSALNALATSYSLVTGTSCRACIKVIKHKTTGDTHTLFTETLVRNKKVPKSQNRDTSAPIEENSDFKILFDTNNDDNFFFSGNLPNEKNYDNSNWPSKHDEREQFIKKKKYKYVSTIVLPIRDREGEDPPTVIGFLCIDSMARNAFSRRYDIDFGATVSDILYPLIAGYRKAFPNP